MRRELTIATPCFNEEESLPGYFQRIDAVREELERDGWSVAQLLINDGSRDATGELLAEFARGRSAVRVFSHPENMGYGAAIKTALALARTEWVVFVDADTNYDQAIILELAARAGDGVDLINVSIFAPGGGRGFPWYRMLLSRTASMIYQVLLPRLTRPVQTMTCGFRWYRRDTAARIFPHADDFTATAESMLRALAGGLRIIEMPASNSKREQGVSKMKFLSVSLGHLRLAAAAALGRLGEPLAIGEHLRVIGLGER